MAGVLRRGGLDRSIFNFGETWGWVWWEGPGHTRRATETLKMVYNADVFEAGMRTKITASRLGRVNTR